MNKAQVKINNIIRSNITDSEKLSWLAAWSYNITRSTPQNPNQGVTFTEVELTAIRRNALILINTLTSADHSDNNMLSILSLQIILLEIPDLWGCTDKNAPNWDPDAIYDDGSCEVYANTNNNH
jgi:hypothetical protein